MLRPIVENDLIDINRWYRERKLPHPDRVVLPPSGIIWPGVAAGYLITTNANIAYLEHFISNKHANGRLREVALEKITENLLGAAIAGGYVAIYVMTSHPRMERLTKKYNFVKTPEFSNWVFRR